MQEIINERNKAMRTYMNVNGDEFCCKCNKDIVKCEHLNGADAYNFYYDFDDIHILHDRIKRT